MKLPPQQTSDLDEAAKAAGCTVDPRRVRGRGPRGEGLQAVRLPDEPADLRRALPRVVRRRRLRPGHRAEPRDARAHARARADQRPVLGKGTPAAEGRQARGAAPGAERGATTCSCTRTRPGGNAAVAATAWTQSLTCPEMNDQVFDAIRSFRARYTDKGPETVP